MGACVVPLSVGLGLMWGDRGRWARRDKQSACVWGRHTSFLGLGFSVCK